METLSFPPELVDVQKRLLEEKIRLERVHTELAELELAEARDKEADRQVRPGKMRRLPVNDVIAGSNTEKWLDALEHWEHRDPGEPIVVTINSPGGSITDGLAVYDTLMRLRRKGHKVVTHGQGLVASMAAVLLQAGDERILDSRAKLLIHEGSSMSGDQKLTPGEMEDYKQFSDMLREDILEILAERSKLTKSQIKTKWKRRDWFLGATEAEKYGFVDRIE